MSHSRVSPSKKENPHFPFHQSDTSALDHYLYGGAFSDHMDGSTASISKVSSLLFFKPSFPRTLR